MKNKYKKIMIYLFSIVIIVIFSFCMYQYSTHFSSRDEAIEKYLTSVFDNDPTQLVEVVVTNSYYLLLRTNGSEIINTTANVKIQNNIFGWKVTTGYEIANADLTKYLIDQKTNTLK